LRLDLEPAEFFLKIGFTIFSTAAGTTTSAPTIGTGYLLLVSFGRPSSGVSTLLLTSFSAPCPSKVKIVKQEGKKYTQKLIQWGSEYRTSQVFEWSI
jgi:hypothetical protein